MLLKIILFKCLKIHKNRACCTCMLFTRFWLGLQIICCHVSCTEDTDGRYEHRYIIVFVCLLMEIEKFDLHRYVCRPDGRYNQRHYRFFVSSLITLTFVAVQFIGRIRWLINNSHLQERLRIQKFVQMRGLWGAL